MKNREVIEALAKMPPGDEFKIEVVSPEDLSIEKLTVEAIRSSGCGSCTVAVIADTGEEMTIIA